MKQPKAVFAFDFKPRRELPGMDFRDLHAAGWEYVRHSCEEGDYVMVFRSKEHDMTLTCRGDSYPEALENLRRHLWREGWLAIRDISTPDDIRAQGWSVAVHNDYRLRGLDHTFWLFTRGNECIKGEGRTDAEALNEVREHLKLMAVAGQRHRPGDPA